MENATTAPPIEYPKVLIGGAEVELRVSQYSTYLLSKAGIGPAQLEEFADPASGRRFYISFELFAGLAGWRLQKDGQRVPTADEWALRLSEEKDPSATYRMMCAAITEAYAKARPVEEKKAPAPPASAEPPSL